MEVVSDRCEEWRVRSQLTQTLLFLTRRAHRFTVRFFIDIMTKKYLYKIKYDDNNKDTLVILLSGFSGGSEMPFVKDLSYFLHNHNSILRINFCNDRFFTNLNNQEELDLHDYVKIIKETLKKIDYKKYKAIKMVGHSFSALILEELIYSKQLDISNITFFFIDPTLYEWIRNIENFGFALKKDSTYYDYKGTKISSTLIKNMRKNTRENFNSQAQFYVIRSEIIKKVASSYYTKIEKKRLITIEKTGHYFSGRKNRKLLSEIITTK